jgi:hypothetical protein
MLATLFAALLQEFAETTPANVEEGKKSISLIFNDRNDDMRLVGVLQPLRTNDVPQDSRRLRLLMQCKAKTSWTYRRRRASGTIAGRSHSATFILRVRCATRILDRERHAVGRRIDASRARDGQQRGLSSAVLNTEAIG